MNRLVCVFFLFCLVTSCSRSRDFCSFDSVSFKSVIFGSDPDLSKVFYHASLEDIKKNGDQEYLTKYYIQQPNAVLHERFGTFRFEDLKVWIETAEPKEWEKTIIDEIGMTLEVDVANIFVRNVVVADISGNEMRFRHYFACSKDQLMILAVNPEKHQHISVP